MAGWFGADFSAEVIQGSGKGQSAQGKMYVSAGRVRTEMRKNDSLMIEIIDPGKGLAWLLDTQNKRYQERAVPRISADSAKSSNPCRGVKGIDCRQLPDEMLNGRSAKKWLLRAKNKERLQWNDARHGFPIQVVESGKVVMAMSFLGEEILQGRRVERWKALQHHGKTVIENEQWYDPQLNIAIRQLAQDGSFRELRNIQLGPQAENLFELPSGYQKFSAMTP